MVNKDSANNYYNTVWKRVFYDDNPSFTFYSCAFNKVTFNTQIEEIFNDIQNNNDTSQIGSFAYKPYGITNQAPSIFNAKAYTGWFLRFKGDTEFSGDIPSNLAWESSRYVQQNNNATDEVDWINDYEYNTNWDKVALWLPFEKRYTFSNTDGLFSNSMALFDESVNANVFHQSINVPISGNPYNPTKLISLDNSGGSTQGDTCGLMNNSISGTIFANLNIDTVPEHFNYKNKFRNIVSPDFTIQFNIKRITTATYTTTSTLDSYELIKFTCSNTANVTGIYIRLNGGLYQIAVNSSFSGIAATLPNFSVGSWVSVIFSTYSDGTCVLWLNGIKVGTIIGAASSTPVRITTMFSRALWFIDDLSIMYAAPYNKDLASVTYTSVSSYIPNFTSQKNARLWLSDIIDDTNNVKEIKHIALKGITPDTPQKGYICNLMYSNKIAPNGLLNYPGNPSGYTINCLATINDHSVARFWFHKIPYSVTGDTPCIWFHYLAKLDAVNNLPNFLPIDSYVNLYLYSSGRTSNTDYDPLVNVSAKRVNVLQSYGQSGATVDLAICSFTESDPYMDKLALYIKNCVDITEVGASTETGCTQITTATYAAAPLNNSGYSPKSSRKSISIYANSSYTLSNSSNTKSIYELGSYYTIDFWYWSPNYANAPYIGCYLQWNSLEIFRMTHGSGLGFSYVSDSSTYINVVSNSTIYPAKTWHHIAIQKERNILRLFINGILRGYTTAAAEVPVDFYGLTMTGNGTGMVGTNTNLWQHVVIDEFRITKIIRWPTTATTLGTTVFSVPTYNTQTYYAMSCADSQIPKGLGTDNLWATDLYVRDKIGISGVNPYIGKCPNLLYGQDGSNVSSVFTPLRVYKMDPALAGNGSPYFVCIGKFGNGNKEAILMRTMINNDNFI